MAINFPNSPALNQKVTVGTDTWSWNGLAWEVQSVDLVQGNNVTLTNDTGTITIAAAGYSLPTATTTVLGGVKVDGSTITIDTLTNKISATAPTPYSLPTASISVLGGVKVDGSSITINGSGVISSASSYTLPAATTTTLGGVIVPIAATSGIINTSGTLELAAATNLSLGGVKVDGTSITINGSGVITATVAALTYGTRTTASTTTANIGVGVAATATISVSKAYILMSIQVSAGAWVSVYSSAAAMSSDSARAITTDPTPGDGVLAEAITTTATTTNFTPAIFAWNNDTPTVGTNCYVRITNNGAISAAITVTLTYLRLE